MIWSEGLRAKYQNMFDNMVIRPSTKFPDGSSIDWKKELNKTIAKINYNKNLYIQVELRTGCAWQVVGIIHGLECGFAMAHLFNGDPLTARTVHVPAGYPKKGSPPFSWVDSAVEAIDYDRMDTATMKDVPYTLYKLELFNGQGYSKLGVSTPYLWSGSYFYEKGKYVRDGVYDEHAMSKQIGAAIILKELAG